MKYNTIMNDSIVKRNRVNKHQSSKEELELLDKKDLIDKILQLEAHTFQLKNIIKKADNNGYNKSGLKKSTKAFDFNQCHNRHILLKFYYLGWNYHGFVEQEDTINTIEHYIFEALKRACLIENRESSNYHRCGRTDKGVSAFSQAISIDVRSKLAPDSQKNISEELSYCKILNRILPRDIKCVAWAPVANTYSARFDCKRRSYKYFFPKGNLDIEAMNQAASYLIGSHDFRNFCEMDVANGVVTFERTILDAGIIQCKNDKSDKSSGYDMCYLFIKSQAFLWHQIRCIMGVLLLIGQKKERPEIIHDLFNIEACPCKPQYSLAHEIPLNLFHCEYDDVDWVYNEEELVNVMKMLQEDWTMNSVKTTMIESMLKDLESHVSSEQNLNFQSECLIQGVQSKVHQPLMKRLTCESLENRIKHFEKKRKIAVGSSSSLEKT